MKDLLLTNKGDIIAYQYPCSKTDEKALAFTDCRSNSYPVLIQSSVAPIKDVTELVGKTVYVQKKGKYWVRLKNLNEEIGGGINIKIIDDSISIDDLIVMVSKGEIPMTIADNDIAVTFKNTLKNINISVQLGLIQERGWVVRKNSPQLLISVNQWFSEVKSSLFYKKLHSKYYDGNLLDKKIIVGSIPKGHISPYDELFKKYAAKINWDWRLLAAVSFNESHFDPNAVSSAGALGLMQMMLGTGAKYGLDSVTIFQPEPTMAASIQYIKSLGLIYRDIHDTDERIKFILASYNAGPAHVLDARALAKKYGEDPNIWQNTKKYLLLKKDPEYYNDEVCKFGYFQGNHTVRYVKDVFDTYNSYMGIK